MSHPADFNYHLLKENTDGKTVYGLYLTSKNITSEKLQKEIAEYKKRKPCGAFFFCSFLLREAGDQLDDDLPLLIGKRCKVEQELLLT